MNTRPTVQSTDPVQVAPFTARAKMEAEFDNRRLARNGVDRRVPVLPAEFNAPDHVAPAAVAAIHRAFTLAKTSHNAWKSFKREGRFDPRRAAGASRLEQDVFQRKTGRSVTKVKVAVLIDASGSMRDTDTGALPDPTAPLGSHRKVKTTAAVAAAVFGCTIAKALGAIPTVDLDVYQHSASSGINYSGKQVVGTGHLFIKWRWHRGTSLGAFNEAVRGIGGGGNADGHALYAIASRMVRELKRDQRGIVMVVSDGMPSAYSSDGTGEAGQALIDAVAYCRKNGIEVIAVAIDGSDQSIYYGKTGTLPFTGDWGLLGKGLADHVGKALARR